MEKKPKNKPDFAADLARHTVRSVVFWTALSATAGLMCGTIRHITKA